MSANLAPFPKFRPLDANGAIIPGFKLYTYTAGTVVPLTTYTDAGGLTPNANPVIGDGDGQADVWFGASSYKLVLKDANDVQIWVVDNVSAGNAVVKDPDASQTISGFALTVTEGIEGTPIGAVTPDTGDFTTLNCTAIQVNGVALNFTNIAGTVAAAQLPARTGEIVISLNGGGSTPSTGVFFELPVSVSCSVTAWTLVADQVGSAQIDVLKSTYAGYGTTASIAGTDKPTLAAVIKNTNAGPLANWGSTAITAGDVLQFNLVSVTTCTRLTLTLTVSIPWS